MKYFYTDPLAAKWMQEKYGMNFISEDGYEISFTDDLEFCTSWIEPFYRDKAFIRSDSLHLLNPQVGDLIHNEPMGECFWIVENPGYDAEVTLEKIKSWTSNKIILRNGLAFMIPQSQE